MTTDTPVNSSAENRRENFRIDNVLPVSLRRIENGVLPTARIVPVAANQANAEIWEGGLNSTFGEFDTNFALMLIEVNSKLDLLLTAQNLHCSAVKGTEASKLSMSQLLLQVNIKLEHLLSAHHLSRPEDNIRLDTVSLSASGIKLKTAESFSPGDLVEVRMLLNINKPFWVVVGGSVVRSIPLAENDYEVAINFEEISEHVSDELSRYTLVDQKKQILARRGFQS
ncbi:MAG: PilZ domain-containing protein [Desulfobulbaceae bacterium]|nr:PilZ domain-containing protein [Desulfobulbaceae bacterium]